MDEKKNDWSGVVLLVLILIFIFSVWQWLTFVSARDSITITEYYSEFAEKHNLQECNAYYCSNETHWCERSGWMVDGEPRPLSKCARIE